MLALLLALQVATTNCWTDTAGGFHCTTNAPQSLAPYDYYGQMQRNLPPQPDYALLAKQQRERAVGQMIANGDCGGAENYALQQGDMDLAQRVRSYCSR